MTKPCVKFESVTFLYETSAAPIFEDLSLQFDVGWTGVIGPNGCGKTTLLRLACGDVAPVAGMVTVPKETVYCPQRTDEPPGLFREFAAATDRDACVLRGQLKIKVDWPDRWDTLSHGERKRVQIAVALWRAPRVLAIDEPTNHIDRDARHMLSGALQSFRGVGLLVSHDRFLLDALCRQCVMIDPPDVVVRPGGYTKALALAGAEADRARRVRARARQELKRLQREAQSRRQEADRADRKRSKRRLKPGQSDAREKIDRARVTSKDAQAGRVLRQMEGRLEQAREHLDRSRVKRTRRLGVEVYGEPAKRDALVRLPAGSLPLGRTRELVFPDLWMSPDDRVALVGPNGGGKSTLVRHVVSQLDLPKRRTVYLAQEIPLAAAKTIIAEVRRLPHKRLGDVMTFVSRLGSNPERLLATDAPSPGELRKLMLALGVARTPYLIVMDEPTNHLDLPSIECLEDALDDCRCGLLLVSHDERFLRRLTRKRWEISEDPSDPHAPMRLHVREAGQEFGSG